MSDWSMLEREYMDRYESYELPFYQDMTVPSASAQCEPQAQQYVSSSPTLTLLLSPQQTAMNTQCNYQTTSKGSNPREIRNRAEKERRDKLNQSISKLASIVPPVVVPGRKMDKTSVLRLTAHYLRSHQYVFGDSINNDRQFTFEFTRSLLKMLRGFLITTTYKGIIVVVSPNVQEYLGYTELDLLGQSIFKIVHEDDHELLKEQLLPKTCMFGPNGELLLSDNPEIRKKVADDLAKDKKNFNIRLKKLSQQRSEPPQYLKCHVEGSLRKADKACPMNKRCRQIVRRARSRGENRLQSGNDVVFVGLVRPTTETFLEESALESFRMEYRTRHTVDGDILQCEQRISLVTGYMIHEVSGVNAMNFMHQDDVQCVIIALREMYDQNRLVGESSYRLMTKNGKFVYMSTKGHLVVDQETNAVTGFVCTNTVLEENEGRHLLEQMKKKFSGWVNNNENNEEPDDDANLVKDAVCPALEN